MAVPTRPLSEINEQAIRVLSKEMGPADAARFISQFTTGYGNYTEERKTLFEDFTLNEVAQKLCNRGAENV